MLAGARDLDLLGWYLLLGGGGRHIDVWVVIDLVTLPQVLDDVKVRPSCFCQTVLQDPTIRFRVWITQSENILHGRLQVPDPRQNQQLMIEETHGDFSSAWTDSHRTTTENTDISSSHRVQLRVSPVQFTTSETASETSHTQNVRLRTELN